MCIEFVCIRKDSSGDQISLIIVNNRDEFFNRPTLPAAPWSSSTSIISGLDKEPGREDGTWLAVNTCDGKIGTLLNIQSPLGPDPSKTGRGKLVTEFVNAPVKALNYLHNIQQSAHSYNLFNLLLLEQKQQKWKAWYYNNLDNSPPVELQEPYIGLSNSPLYRPWNKVTLGLEKFKEICQHYSEPSEHLREELLQLMQSKDQTWPDVTMDQQTPPSHSLSVKKERSAVFVESLAVNYGTRTTTLITVQANGSGEYYEKTRTLNPDETVTWSHQIHNFQIPL